LPAQPQPEGRILLADDNADMRAYVERLLGRRWRVEAVADGGAALASARASKPALVISDVMMPGMSGVELLAALRSDPRTRGIPVILLSARAGEEARIEGLAAGADDYLVKPFAFDELLARLRAVGRRGRSRHLNHLLEYGGIAIDPVAHVVTVAGCPVTLTATEYRLLTFLVRRAESVVTRDQLAQHVWGGEYDPLSNNADVYVGYVRRKLQGAAAAPLIHTVRGLGYMLKREGAAS
jgi:DNA-binding response OmpR family regulator